MPRLPFRLVHCTSAWLVNWAKLVALALTTPLSTRVSCLPTAISRLASALVCN
ncbi:hypothetical protein D3C79_604160 [compost metagenome]